MKYIRAQNGMILSVSQLIPPAKGQRHDVLADADNEIWRLNVITVDGQRFTYATYTKMELALAVFSGHMIPFICSERSAILFPLGEETDPRAWQPDTVAKPCADSADGSEGDGSVPA